MSGSVVWQRDGQRNGCQGTRALTEAEVTDPDLESSGEGRREKERRGGEKREEGRKRSEIVL
jgi:hypothetical protein